jgi:signal transduction histidine kinase
MGEIVTRTSPVDRRPESDRAIRRRRAAEAALVDALLRPETVATGDLAHLGIGAEAQTLLIRALARLEHQRDVEAAVAWARTEDATPRVVGALPAVAAERTPPTGETFRALAALDRVQRLTDPNLPPALSPLAAAGVSAVAPIGPPGESARAALLLYPAKPGRPLRPRTIAVLGEVATRLAETVETSQAIERMSSLDQSIRRLDRLAALGGLVSEIVHEIRNPLVSVKTFLQLLPDRLDDPDFHGEFRDLVSNEVRRLERMLDDLLRHARPAEGKPLEAAARIDEAIATTVQLLTYRARERGVVFESAIRSELPALGLARDALRQVLMNLLINALSVTPEGGRIALRADWSDTTANAVELLIEDQGPGIPPALRECVFEPFFTTRRESAGGLGLAICKRIVDEAGGTIAAVDPREPERGGGCFRLELPIER